MSAAHVMGVFDALDHHPRPRGRLARPRAGAAMSFERLRNVWENVETSLWFRPAVLGLLAVVLSYLLPELDTHLSREVAAHRYWLFYGSPSATRTLLSTLAGALITVITLLSTLAGALITVITLLSTLAGALITVITVLFSITMVVL